MDDFYRFTLLTLYLLSPLTILPLQTITAPYGRHFRRGWGPSIPPSLAWLLMESPTVWLSALLLPLGRHRLHPKSLLLCSAFLLHYTHRTLIYPLRLRRKGRPLRRPFPLSVAALAFSFNLLNTYVQIRWVSHFADYDRLPWWLILVGSAVFAAGMAVNVWSDLVLVGLKGEEGEYKVPKGGLFEWVCCPNYLGEMVEWLGWAVMTWSWAGFGFFSYTCANLGPRARAHRRWYLEKFGEEFPASRKAVVPFVY
ncbi:Steroid 5-alpha-reductase DET2 [Acorus calamus]|uniref:Steroid 5-alpha-reductase DET2 n=1 Tax=Acorus calamus TaxID=4465 RepID=A0AAV9DCV9_ACOCL|nr:Steroid 5-alpha-reductase DET2 [Acorus calamus]